MRRARPAAGIVAHLPSSAAEAARTARSTSSAPAWATSQIGSPVDGSTVSNVRPSAASLHSAPISSLCGPLEMKSRGASESASAVAVVMRREDSVAPWRGAWQS